MTWKLRDQAKQINSPPLQGRGRGWGLTAERIEELGSYAKDMRREPTEPEKRLWRALSRSQLRGFAASRESVFCTRRREGAKKAGVTLNAFKHRHAELVSASSESNAGGYVWPLWTPDQVRGDEIAISLEGSVG